MSYLGKKTVAAALISSVLTTGFSGVSQAGSWIGSATSDKNDKECTFSIGGYGKERVSHTCCADEMERQRVEVKDPNGKLRRLWVSGGSCGPAAEGSDPSDRTPNNDSPGGGIMGNGPSVGPSSSLN